MANAAPRGSRRDLCTLRSPGPVILTRRRLVAGKVDEFQPRTIGIAKIGSRPVDHPAFVGFVIEQFDTVLGQMFPYGPIAFGIDDECVVYVIPRIVPVDGRVFGAEQNAGSASIHEGVFFAVGNDLGTADHASIKRDALIKVGNGNGEMGDALACDHGEHYSVTE